MLGPKLMHRLALDAHIERKFIAMLFNPNAPRHHRNQAVGAFAARPPASTEPIFHVFDAHVFLRPLRQLNHARPVQSDHRLFRVVVQTLANDQHGLAIVVSLWVRETRYRQPEKRRPPSSSTESETRRGCTRCCTRRNSWCTAPSPHRNLHCPEPPHSPHPTGPQRCRSAYRSSCSADENPQAAPPAYASQSPVAPTPVLPDGGLAGACALRRFGAVREPGLRR